MNYTFIYNGISYDLPRYTKSVKKAIEKVNADNNSSLTDDEKYKRMYLFVRDMLGAEAVLEILGSDDLEQIDLHEITICYFKIVKSYDDQLNSHLHEYDEEKISRMLEILNSAGNIRELEKYAERVKKQNMYSPIRAL